MAKILLTGGAGFIGSNLRPELESRGHDVWVCDIVHGDSDKHIRCDVSKFHQLARIFEKHKFDYIYHMAAEYGRWNGEDYYENLWSTNTIGTKNLIRLQEKYKFRVIFFSSAEVYGDYEGVIDEAVMDRVPIKQMNDYAMTKWVGELQFLNSAAMFGTETVRVRPVNAYGPHEHYSPYRGVIPIFIYKALHDMPYIVYLNHKRIFDYVGDTCKTFANIVDNFKPGEVYHIAGKKEWESDIKYVSDTILRILKKDDSKVIYKTAEPFTTKKKTMDCSRAIRDLKHNPVTPLEEGLIYAINWMKSIYRK